MSPATRKKRPRLRIVPAEPGNWADLVALFGSRGACGGCWCMFPRRTRAEFERGKGAGNRRALRRLVGQNPAPGLLGYVEDQAVGWCSIEPREAFSSLARSRLFRPLDDLPVWSIVCLFVDREHRRQGLSVAMIRGAVDWARSQGARCVEAYPVEPSGPVPAAFAWHGLASAYSSAGFKEVARPSETRRVMRRMLRRRTQADEIA